MCEQDIEARRARDLERYHRRTAERKVAGSISDDIMPEEERA